MLNLKNTETGYRFLNYKEVSCFYVLGNLSFVAFKKLNKNLSQIKEDSIEVTLSKFVPKSLVEKHYGYTLFNKWYVCRVPKNLDTTFNKSIEIITNREEIKTLIESKQMDCAKRDPQKFDKNHKDANWLKFGNEAVAVKLNGKVLSMLTFTEEENKNLRIRLIATDKLYKRHGFGQILVEHAFKIAASRNLKTISFCVDNSEGAHIENLAKNFKFKHVKNGYVKIIR